MTDERQPSPQTISAEIVMSAVFKLFGIYMIFNAVLQSSNVMSALYSIAATMTGGTGVQMQQWGMLGSSMFAVILGVGFALILIRHGDRAAHWFSMRTELQVPVMTPSRAWYRGALVVIGVWVLATQLMPVATTLVWVVISAWDDSGSFGFPNPFPYALISMFHVAALVVVGLALILRAGDLGDRLYRVTGAEEADATLAETP